MHEVYQHGQIDKTNARQQPGISTEADVRAISEHGMQAVRPKSAQCHAIDHRIICQSALPVRHSIDRRPAKGLLYLALRRQLIDNMRQHLRQNIACLAVIKSKLLGYLTDLRRA